MKRRGFTHATIASTLVVRRAAAVFARRAFLGAPALAAARPADARTAFALIGDTPYNVLEERALAHVLADFDPGVVFAIHVGDIKSGWEPCSDALFDSRRALLGAARVPLVFTPGDNEWIDCARGAAGGHDPIERLGRLRSLFHRDRPSAAGIAGLSSQQSASVEFPENQRWRSGAAMFATINLPGSNNGGDAGASIAAHNTARAIANEAWLRDSFELARGERLPGIVVAAHANPGFERDRRLSWAPGGGRNERDAYRAFRDLLRELVRRHDIQVLFLHGDTHRFRVDRPLSDARGETLRNFRRVECFGSPFSTYWVRISVDPRRDPLFAIETRQASL